MRKGDVNSSDDPSTSGELLSSNSGVYEAQLCTATAGFDRHSG